MTKQEYAGGIDFTSFIDKDGFQHSLTARGETSAQAYADLQASIALAIKEGGVPFVRDYNKAELDKPSPPEQPESRYPVDPQAPTSVVAQAQQLGGQVVTYVTPEESASIASGLLEIPEGHLYLGMKPSKLDEIGENESYQVLAESYSYDGTWVNFYNGAGNMSVAGSYYANPTGMKIFDGMFHWQPQLVEKAQLPGGNVLLYILGVNNKGTIYQNIKMVDLA